MIPDSVLSITGPEFDPGDFFLILSISKLALQATSQYISTNHTSAVNKAKHLAFTEQLIVKMWWKSIVLYPK